MLRNEQISQHFTRAQNFLARLKLGAPLTVKAPLTAEYARSAEPVPFAQRLSAKYLPIEKGGKWGEAWDSAWFHVTGAVPPEWRGKKVVAHLDFNGEACVFDGVGCPLFGLTNGSVFAGNYNKDGYYLFNSARGGETVDLWIEVAANQLFGINVPADPKRDDAKRHGEYEGKVVNLELAVFDDEIWGLLLDVEVLISLFLAARVGAGANGTENSWGSGKTIPDITPRAKKILFALKQAIDLYADNPENAAAARALLRQAWTPANASDLTVTAVGHAHIDVGWLWPVRESIRKAGRTFASQIALMEKYPDYVFGASQPQLYQMVKDHYPALYEKIKARVKSGKWELQGAMWVEADCNVISGESMVRQFIHGKNFFRDEFGVEVKNLWIPDVFGYSAAMPQIMKKSGVDFFLTQKISWSQFNQFPFHTFRWRGIDNNAEVITHFPPENTYNSDALPEAQVKAQNNFKENHLLDEMLCLYGIGDGGGGPKEEYVERVLRTQNLEGAPKARFGRADEFFERLAPHKDELELWSGELYLELHRATLTTQARTKKGNRQLEQALRDAEFFCAAFPAKNYPRAQFDGIWKTLLLNQFHDILPGSSIHKVYEVTEREHREGIAACRAIIAETAKQNLTADSDALTLVNTLPFAYTAPIALPDDWKNQGAATLNGVVVPTQTDANGAVALLPIPACSAITLKKAAAVTDGADGATGGLVLENELIRYEFGANATVLRAFDKELQREFIEPGAKGNLLSLYVDRSNNWDAWDIDLFYEEEHREFAQAVSAKPTPLAKGMARWGLKFSLRIGESTLEQSVYLNAHSKRLDFITRVEWQEYHKMLRVAFPVAVRANEASFDIQYGYAKRPTHRNTSWDLARFEVAAQKYADLSNADFGAAILNNCKYGHKIIENTLDLNLLRASTHPDPDADLGTHEFTYSFLPHRGSLAESPVLAEAAQLNFPPIAVAGYRADNFTAPLTIDNPAITLGAVKQAEKEDSIVIRLVEAAGRHTTATVTLNRGEKLVACDLLEWHDGEVLSGKIHELKFTPFEIKTFKIR